MLFARAFAHTHIIHGSYILPHSVPWSHKGRVIYIMNVTHTVKAEAMYSIMCVVWPCTYGTWYGTDDASILKMEAKWSSIGVTLKERGLVAKTGDVIQ